MWGLDVRVLKRKNQVRCGILVNCLVCCVCLQGMIAMRREGTELTHEDYMDAIIEVQAKKKTNLQYYA